MNVHRSQGCLDWRLSEAFHPNRRNSKSAELRVVFDAVALLAIPDQAQAVRLWLREPVAEDREARHEFFRRMLLAEFRRRLPELIARMEDDTRLPASAQRILRALVALGEAEPAIDSTAQVD